MTAEQEALRLLSLGLHPATVAVLTRQCPAHAHRGRRYPSRCEVCARTRRRDERGTTR